MRLQRTQRLHPSAVHAFQSRTGTPCRQTTYSCGTRFMPSRVAVTTAQSAMLYRAARSYSGTCHVPVTSSCHHGVRTDHAWTRLAQQRSKS